MCFTQTPFDSASHFRHTSSRRLYSAASARSSDGSAAMRSLISSDISAFPAASSRQRVQGFFPAVIP